MESILRLALSISSAASTYWLWQNRDSIELPSIFQKQYYTVDGSDPRRDVIKDVQVSELKDLNRCFALNSDSLVLKLQPITKVWKFRSPCHHVAAATISDESRWIFNSDSPMLRELLKGNPQLVRYIKPDAYTGSLAGFVRDLSEDEFFKHVPKRFQ